MESNRYRHVTQAESKWNQTTGIRIEPGCNPTRIRLEMGSKGDPNGIQLEPNWIEMESEWIPNGTRMEFNWNPIVTQAEPKTEPKWKPHGIQLEL